MENKKHTLKGTGSKVPQWVKAPKETRTFNGLVCSYWDREKRREVGIFKERYFSPRFKWGLRYRSTDSEGKAIDCWGLPFPFRTKRGAVASAVQAYGQSIRTEVQRNKFRRWGSG